jgi:hypothetical protein
MRTGYDPNQFTKQQKIKWLLSELLYLLVGIDFNAH